MRTITERITKTLITMYFRKEEAATVVQKLNDMYRRYEFRYEEHGGAFYIYCLHDKKDDNEMLREILIFLLDRMAYKL